MARTTPRPRRLEPTLGGVHWADTSREPHVPQPPLDADLDVDIAVVGAGFAGLSIAREAAKTGARVAVLEAGRVGCGASGRNGGFAVPHVYGPFSVADVTARLGTHKGEALAALATEGPSIVMDTIRRYQIACDAEQNGWIQPAHSAASLAKVRAIYESWRAFGAPVRWLDGEAVRAATGSPGYLGGWTRANGAMVNPTALVRGLARAALNEGALIFETSPVSAIGHEAGRPALTVNGHRIRARKVALATNGYTDCLFTREHRSLIPIQLFHTVTEPLGERDTAHIMPGRIPLGDLRKSGGFARYDRDSRLISGGLVVSPLKDKRRGFAHARRRVRELFPQLSAPEPVAYWSGWCAASRHHLPRVERLAPDIFSLGGYVTRGVCLSQTVGAALGEVLTERRDLAALPVAVCEGADVIPLQGLKALAAQVIFPAYVAMDRLRLS